MKSKSNVSQLIRIKNKMKDITTIKPGYKKTAIGIIPEDWEVKRLGKLATLKSGGTPLRDEPKYWGGEIPWLTTSLINYNTIFSVEEYITKEGLKNSSAKVFPKGTTVMAIYGQGVTRGKVARLGFDMTTNQACIAFLNDNLNFQEFLFYSLAKNYQRLRDLSNDGSQKNLSAKLLKEFKLPIPPLPEQKAIADCLSTWDKAIEKQTQLIKAKKEFKKGLMQGFFNGQLTVENGQIIKAKEGEDFTEDWEEVRLGEIGNFISGNGFPVAEQGGEKGIPFYKVSDMNSTGNETEMTVSNNYVTDEQMKKLKLKPITKKSLLFAKVGAAIFLERKRIAQNYLMDNNMMAFIPLEFNHFIRYAFELISLSKYAQIGALPSYNASDLKIIKTKLPPDKLQNSIAQVLQYADKEIELQEKKLKQLQIQKKGLMQVLLTGKLRLV